MEYRSEIDGLRALAVLPVILFHAGFQTFCGGFVGVDVFFVISGYLITTIILAEKQAGQFSIISFYERRARRILPALFVVMIVCLPFAWLWLLPQHLKSFSQSLVAVSVFASNVLFWQTSGYFDRAVDMKPLLHTWSLAVEEQYYLFFPIFLILTWRFGNRLTLTLLAMVFAASIAAAQWFSFYNAEAAFYLLPTRGWELLVGVFVAFYSSIHVKPSPGNGVSEIGGIVGLLLIIYAIFAFDKHTPSPSLYTLAPTVGTALVIVCATKSTLVGRLLGNKIFVGIGLISYSAYLWHQPLLAFVKHRVEGAPSKLLLGGLVIVAITLAYFTWRYVETPFRQKQRFGRKQVFFLGTLGGLFFISIGFIGHIDKGNLLRFDRENFARGLAAQTNENRMRQICRIDSVESLNLPNNQCWYGSGDYKILVWGDSHVDTTSLTLSEALPMARIYHAGHAACPPILGLILVSNNSSDCLDFNNQVFEFLKRERFDAVVLSARWRAYAEGTPFDNGEGGVDAFTSRYSTSSKFEDEEQRFASVINAYVESIEKVATAVFPAKVILVYQIPEVGFNVPDAFFKTIHRGKQPPTVLTTSYDIYKDSNKRVSDSLDRIASPNLVRIFPHTSLCDEDVKGRCVVVRDGQLLYIDEDHLSFDGARIVTATYVAAIKPYIEDVKRMPPSIGSDNDFRSKS